MTPEKEELLRRFADVLHDVPHRPTCQRSIGESHAKCSCDIGGKLTPIFEGFVELLSAD